MNHYALSKSCSLFSQKFSKFLLPLLFASLLGCTPVSSQQVYEVPDSTQNYSQPPVQVFYYPNSGQSSIQQDRDQYECYLWASQQSGFDPSKPNLAPHHRVQLVRESPSGQNTLVGAVAGAVIGAAIGSPHNTAQGAIIGGVSGAVIGAASEASQNERLQVQNRQYGKQVESQYAENEKLAKNYRRALGACLEGRGYTVR